MLAYAVMLVVLLAGCQSADQQTVSHLANNDSLLTVPTAPAPVLDGRLAEGEWTQALQQELTGGGRLYLQHEDRYLYIALRGVAPGWGHVYLQDNDSLRVLHASAALGMAVYQQENEESLQLKREFSWAMRDPTLTDEANAARAAYLEQHGWVASTGDMGVPEELEYKIDKRLLGSALVLAVVYAATPEKPLFWPSSLQDATLNADLIRGTTPVTLTFDPPSWQSAVFAH